MQRILHSYRQHKQGYCSPLLLANIFNDSKFLDYLKNDNFESCDDDQWDEMINNFDPSLEIVDVLYLSHDFGNSKLPLNLIGEVVKKEIETGYHFPIFYYFLTVQRTSIDIWHATAILNINNTLWYSDPYNEYMFQFDDINLLENQFVKCNRIRTLIAKEYDKYVYLKGDYVFGSKVQNTLLTKII